MESMRRNEANTSHHPNKVSSLTPLTSPLPSLEHTFHSSTSDKNCNYFIVICFCCATHLARHDLKWAAVSQVATRVYRVLWQEIKQNSDDNNGQNEQLKSGKAMQEHTLNVLGSTAQWANRDF